ARAVFVVLIGRLRLGSSLFPYTTLFRSRVHAALEVGDAVLHDLGGRIRDAGVDRAEIGQGEAVGRGLIAVEDVRGGLVDGQGSGTGGRVGALPGVDLAGGDCLARGASSVRAWVV